MRKTKKVILGCGGVGWTAFAVSRNRRVRSYFFIWDNCRWRVLAKINEIKKRNGKKVPPRRFWDSNQNFLLRQNNRGRNFFLRFVFFLRLQFSPDGLKRFLLCLISMQQSLIVLGDLCSSFQMSTMPGLGTSGVNLWSRCQLKRIIRRLSKLIELYKLASLNLWPGFLSRIELEPTLQSCYFPVFSVKLVPAVPKVPDSGSSKN